MAATSAIGHLSGISVERNRLAVSLGYQSKTLIIGSATFENQSLISLGVTPGIYNYSIPNDIITLVIEEAAVVPEPSSFSLLATAALGLPYRVRRSSGR